MKTEFEHCNRCVYVENCYRDGREAIFIEPACSIGPATGEEGDV